LISRVNIGKLLARSNWLSVLAAFTFLIAVMSGRLSVPIAVVSMFIFTLGVGIAAPAALTSAISVNPKAVGSASGLYGFAQMAIGALCTMLAGLGSDPALAVGIVLSGAGIVSQASFWIAQRKSKTV
jgi:MFS transporter, DHA1 family, multidrug resistance protein